MTIHIAENQPELLTLRIDDVGASSKKYEVNSNKVGKVKVSGNWFFLKHLPAYKAWGRYRELRAEEWVAILDLLEGYKAKLAV